MNSSITYEWRKEQWAVTDNSDNYYFPHVLSMPKKKLSFIKYFR
jgi:hypothetical protein